MRPLFSSCLLVAAVVAVGTAGCAFNVEPHGPKGGGASDATANLDRDVTVKGVTFTADQARKALNVVNGASHEILDHRVGFDRRAAANVIDARPIADLNALASVSFVGRSSLNHLRAFVNAHDDAFLAALPAQCDARGLAMPGPGAFASDKRVPELGDDVAVIGGAAGARTSLQAGVAQLAREKGPVIEAKMELNDEGALSLSVYPVDGLDKDAERAAFREASGTPAATPFAYEMETFTDREHLVRSSRDLTLVQISQVGVGDAADDVGGFVYWSIPTIEWGRAGYGVYSMDPFTCESSYTFVDGLGSDDSNWWDPADLGNGPGAGATDARTPELGDDLTVLRSSKITMADALAQVEAERGEAIEAKFEIGDDGKLSLSIYPNADVTLDAERSTFVEAAGDPTADAFAPGLETFADDDVEHQTRSARDLTLVQTASLTLADAVWAADQALPRGFVYWAIPTIRDGRSGYGVYSLADDDTVHYFFID